MTQTELLSKLKTRVLPADLLFSPGDVYYWSPAEKTVYYKASDKSKVGLWTLLHEACHGMLKHTRYNSDFELIGLEVDAWEKAKELADELDLAIDEDHVQDCLDSYRDWQYKRSLCPLCGLGGLQTNPHTYICLFCDGKWNVSAARFCRPYRRKAT